MDTRLPESANDDYWYSSVGEVRPESTNDDDGGWFFGITFIGALAIIAVVLVAVIAGVCWVVRNSAG